ncbi:MAG: hypothetical protein K6E14_11190 [Paludibacteraceae bacterium]|nr:hypothetical protein [Paludibacteraceae bacterium]
MYNKIVDTVVASSREKPLAGGKCENWWSELDGDSHGLKKKGANIRNSGRIRQNSYMPQTINNALLFYKFKGFEFGNYMSQADRYDIFTAFLYCMQDLRKWLGTTNFGIKHQIGVAFGARGEGRFSAHYEPMTNIINMTKKRGAGALLHEYAHALDYTIGAFIDQCKGYTSLSGGRMKKQLSDNVGCQFRAMMNKMLNYVRQTESFQKLKKATDNSDYWCNSTELFARLTESYYAYYHNDSHNYYLVKPTSFYERSYGIYLSKAEMDVIKPELDKFWKEVGLLLNDKCKLKATPYPKDTTVKKKVKKTKLYFPVTDEYTDGTYREIKRKGGLPKPGTEAWQPLERWLAHYDSLEGKRRGLGIYKSYKIISRTKYSIRYRNNKGEYIESYIVGEDGKRLKEPAPKKKEIKQKPIQF